MGDPVSSGRGLNGLRAPLAGGTAAVLIASGGGFAWNDLAERMSVLSEAVGTLRAEQAVDRSMIMNLVRRQDTLELRIETLRDEIRKLERREP